MSLRKPIRLAAAGLLLVVASAGTVAAQNDSEGNAALSPERLSAQLKHEELSGSQVVQRAYIACGTNRFAFVVPPGYRLDGSNPDKIVLSNADCSSYITFQVDGQPGPSIEELQSERCREWVLARYADARILVDFSQSAANHTGPAFDLEWTNSARVVQYARVAYIPSPAGVLEFSLIATAGKFREGQYFLNSVMLTFRSNEGGKLEIVPLSDKF